MAALKDRIATDIWEKLQQAASKFKGSHKVTAMSCYCKLTAKAWHAWHRRWIKTEEKAKVVASVWGGGQNLFNSLPRKVFCTIRFEDYRMNCTRKT